MHPGRLIVAGLLLLSVGIPSRTAAEMDPTVSLSTSHLLGSTQYRISFPYVEADPQDIGQSELEFPLDVFLGGLKISLGENPAHRHRLSWIGAVRRNINDPSGAMTDSDWIGSRLVSYTESSAALSVWQVVLGCRFRFARGERAALAAEVGYRYSRFSYKIYGLEGWYDSEWLGDGAGRHFFVLDAGTHVLDYRVSYHLPLMGCVAEFRPASWFETELGVHVAPRAYAEDFDDHLLRFKSARAAATGTAYTVGLSLQANLPSANTRHEFFFELHLEWIRIATDGDQTQEWYADDPLSEADDAGVRASGIDDEISASVGRLGARAGWRF